MPVWLLTGIGAARNVAKGTFTWITANTTHLLAVILAISALWGFYERHEAAKYHSALESCSAARKSDQAEWKRQVAAAKAATDKAKQDGKDSAHDAQEYRSQLQSAKNDLVRAYADARRVRPIARSATPAGPSGRNDPPVPTEAPAMPTVAVPESVLNTCDDDYTYAAGAYRLGQDLLAKGLAVPGKD